jgi:hypothetical protein
VDLCRICGTKPAIRSHLIPEAFVREIRYAPKSDEKHMLVHNDRNVKTSSNTGRFERDLLCATCDGILGSFEWFALNLLKRLRHVKIGKKIGTQSMVSEGSYPFRVSKVDEFIRFACGILWKYAALCSTNPSFINIGNYRSVCEEICFRGGAVPDDVDVFIERDLFSYAAFPDPTDVYYYCTPSTGLRDGRYMAWFSVGGFIIYVRMDRHGSSSFAPKRCWMRGKKRCFFNVAMRAVETNIGIAESIGLAKEDLARLNKKLLLPRSA